MKKPIDRILYGEEQPDGLVPFWKMTTLWAAAQGRPATLVAIDSLNVLDQVVWFGGPKNVQPTVRKIAEHAKGIRDADLSFPIILSKSGDVLDGAHRIAKAYLNGDQVISAVILDDWPTSDGHLNARQVK